MAGTSRRELSDFYEGELSGVIASNWGEDVMVTCDDKLHMSEQTTVQEVKGPVNFSKSGSTYTFASPVNFSSTIITPNSNNLASLTTGEVSQLLNIGTALITAGEWSQLANIGAASITAGEWSQIANIGAASIAAGEWGYLAAMNQSVASSATVAFAGVDLVNTVNEFSVDTTLAGNSDTAVPTERVVKTYTDLRALWNADNSAVTGYYSIGPIELLLFSDRTTGGGFTWSYDTSGKQARNPNNLENWLGIHLVHGATITAFRVTSQEASGATMSLALYRRIRSSGVESVMVSINATSTMEEISETGISDAVIDNDLYSYAIKVLIADNISNCYIRGIQIDYTVVRPQP